MAVPGFQTFMRPLLDLAADGREHRLGDALAAVADRMGLSEADRALQLPSRAQTRLYNRVTWAVTYLTKAGLLHKPARGRFVITDRGRRVLAEDPATLDMAYLERFPEFVEFRAKRSTPDDASPDAGGGRATADDDERTPEERLQAAYEELRGAAIVEVLERVRAATPAGFERIVVRLLVAMGYGGGELEHARVTGQSGDGGIDGEIREDKLGLDMVYVQAKKWENTVGPGEIGKFVGSLMRRRATKGVFITSGQYTDGARAAARDGGVRVRLIDGDELAALMVDHGVGVAADRTLVTSKLDSDFFDEIEP